MTMMMSLAIKRSNNKQWMGAVAAAFGQRQFVREWLVKQHRG
jgi:hypothetical protein